MRMIVGQLFSDGKLILGLALFCISITREKFEQKLLFSPWLDSVDFCVMFIIK